MSQSLNIDMTFNKGSVISHRFWFPEGKKYEQKIWGLPALLLGDFCSSFCTVCVWPGSVFQIQQGFEI